MKIPLLALGLLMAPAPHDSYISILTIHHSAEKKELDLTWRMTAHDIEHALEPQGRLQLGSTHENPKADSLINAYLHEHLELTLGTKRLDWQWLGRQLDTEDLYCYMQIDGVINVDGLVVKNTLLQDVFGEQQNIVDLETDHGTFTKDLTRDSPPYTFRVQ